MSRIIWTEAELLSKDFVATLKETDYENAKEALYIALKECDKELASLWKRIQEYEDSNKENSNLLFQMEKETKNVKNVLKQRIQELQAELEKCKKKSEASSPKKEGLQFPIDMVVLGNLKF